MDIQILEFFSKKTFKNNDLAYEKTYPCNFGEKTHKKYFY